METKTYFATSLQSAMETARKELGTEALLVDSRPTPAEARQFGPLEVTFAWERRQPARRSDAGLDDLRREISELRSAIRKQPGRATTILAGDPDEEAVNALCETGFTREVARQLVLSANGVRQEIASRISVMSFPALKAGETRMIAFIGAAGRGKTTSLVKVAVQYGIAKGVPVRIYQAGAHGVGAREQMARYAAILGAPFQAIEPYEGLNLALQGEGWKGLVLIDTPGFGREDRQEMDAMAKVFARHTEIETHLVLRADARSADMQYTVSRFAALRPGRLLFTGLDEVRGLGAVAETMMRSGIAATWFGTGTRIPEDLEEVDATRLVRSLWAENTRAARAAA